MRFYAGIGSRQTPQSVLVRMQEIAEDLAARGFILRSGGAVGADSAFEAGAGPQSEIYLPWPRYNGNPSPLYPPTPAAIELAASIHPAWDRCSQGARKLLARNCHQILGPDLTSPVEFVVCWHLGTGGTMQAVRLAMARGIPVVNLATRDFTL